MYPTTEKGGRGREERWTVRGRGKGALQTPKATNKIEDKRLEKEDKEESA